MLQSFGHVDVCNVLEDSPSRTAVSKKSAARIAGGADKQLHLDSPQKKLRFLRRGMRNVSKLHMVENMLP